MKKVLITATAHPILEQTLSRHGYEVIYKPNVMAEELDNYIGDLYGIVVTTRIKLDKDLLDRGKTLQWIGRLGSGLEHIDTGHAQSLGIACYSTPEGNCTSVGEHALGMLLSLMHRICHSSIEVRNNIWLRNENRGIELTGKTVGIIGLGHTGSAFAKVLQGFDVRILANDKYKDISDNRFGAIAADLDVISKEAEIISFHLPFTDDTRGMGNEQFFTGLERKPIIINTSRGAVINSRALLSAIDNGFVSGACLDVLENENLKALNAEEKNIFEQMQGSDKVLLTPHIAGYSQEASYKMSTYLLHKLGLALLS